MSRSRSLLVAAVLAAGLVPAAGANADPCGEPQNTVIFSATGVDGAAIVGTPNQAALTCLALQPELDSAGVDPHIINPGSTHVSVRHTEDYGEGTPELKVVLSGLGFDDVELVAARTAFATGGYTYDTPRTAIADGPTATGSITATVYDGDAIVDEVTFYKHA